MTRHVVSCGPFIKAPTLHYPVIEYFLRINGYYLPLAISIRISSLIPPCQANTFQLFVNGMQRCWIHDVYDRAGIHFRVNLNAVEVTKEVALVHNTNTMTEHFF